jgi:ribose transport system permease protein
VAYAAIMAWLVPGFGTSSNAVNILTAFAPLFVVALGQTLVLVSAGIDLSVTSVIAAAGVCGGWLVSQDGGLLAGHAWAVPLAMLLMLAMGSFIGSINGYCIAVLRMPPFIVTLTMMMFLSGMALWGTQSQAIAGLPASFLMFGQTTWLTALVAVGLAVWLHIVLQHSLFGLHLRSVGFNAATARVSGVPVNRTVVWAYVISGGCAALASILIAGQLESCSPVQWENNLLDIVGATVIGGTSLYGGRGNVSWTAGGALLLVLIDNSLNLMSLSYFAIMITKGGVILLAALLDTARNRLSPTGVV